MADVAGAEGARQLGLDLLAEPARDHARNLDDRGRAARADVERPPVGAILLQRQRAAARDVAHVDEVAKLVVDKSPALNLDLKQQTAQLKAEKDFMASSKGLFSMDQATWQTGIDILKTLNQIDKPITAAEVMSTSILEMAAKGP
jgi:hypothetical protein